MRKINAIVIVLFSLSISFSTSAQDQKEKFSLSVGGDVAFPTRSNSFYPGFGGTVKGAFSITSKTSITLTTGYISFKGKSLEDGSTVFGERFIPVRIGLQYKLSSRFYLEPQAGYAKKIYGSFISNGVETSPPSVNTFNYAFNVGYLIHKNFDISARFEDYIYQSKSQLPQIGLRISYRFKL